MFGLFMVLPVLALWAGKLEGATPLLVGIAVGGYGVTQALLQIPYGSLSDRIGRGPVIVFGLSIFLIGSAIAASSESIGGLIAGRLLQGAGAVSATLSAWLADHTRESVRTPAMAIFGAAIGGSFLLALVLGPLLSAVFGVRGLFWASVGFAAFGITLTLLAMRKPGRNVVPTQKERWRWDALLRADLMALNLAVLLLHALLTAFFVVVPIVLLEQVGIASAAQWKVYVVTLALSLPIAIPLIMRDGRSGSGRFQNFSLVLATVGLAGIALFPGELLALGAGCVLFFAGFNYLEASLPAMVSLRADIDQRGASLGVFSSSQFFGAFVGSTAAGWLMGYSGPVTALWGLTFIAAAWLIANVALSVVNRR